MEGGSDGARTSPLGAFHASELPFVFQPAAATAATFFTPAELRLSDRMIGYWTKFALSGNPNGRAAPGWERFTNRENSFQSLAPDATGSVTTFAADHRCAFWASLAA